MVWRCIAQISESPAFFGVVCGITNAMEQLFGKTLATDLGPFQYNFYRLTFQTLIISALIFATKGSFLPHKDEYSYMFHRCWTVNLFYVFTTFSYIYISFLDVIIFYVAFSCITSLILSRGVLKEKLHNFTVVMMIIILAGIIILCDPRRLVNMLLDAYTSGQHSYYIGVFFISFSGIFNAASAFSNKFLNETPILTSTFYMSVTGFGFALIGSFVPVRQEFSLDGYVILKSVLCACMSGCSTLAINKGLRIGRLMEIMLATEIEIPFSIAVQYLIFPRTVLCPSKILAIVMIIFGILSITIQDWLLEKVSSYFS